MKNRSIKYNVIFNMLLTLSNIVFPIITFPYVSRVLAPEGLGITSFFSSLGSYATLIATLGMGTYGIRQISRVRNNKKELTKIVQELVIINLFMALIVVSTLVISSFFVEKLNSEYILFIIMCITVLSSVFSLDWLYGGLEQYDYITKRSILFKFISLILIFLFVKESEDYTVYMGISLFSTLGSNILNVYYSSNYISFKLVKDLEFKKHIKPILFLFSSLLAVNVYTNLDSVMLGFISGNEAVGLFAVASKVKWLLLMLITSGSTVLLPRLSLHASNNDVERYNKILKDSIVIIALVSVPMASYFFLVARDSVVLLGGEDFVSATLPMQILMPILLISGFSNITGNQILLPLNKEKYFMYAVTSGAILNLILNFILMPMYGIVGAAIATLLAEFCQMLIQFYYSKEYLKGNIDYDSVLKIIISSTVSSIILYITMKVGIYKYDMLINLVLSSMEFFIAYAILLLLLREKTANRILTNFKTINLKRIN